MSRAKAIFSYRPGCAAASRDIRHTMRLTFGLLPMGCVETGSHLCTEFCVFYCDKDIENDIIVATNVAFQFNEK